MAKLHPRLADWLHRHESDFQPPLKPPGGTIEPEIFGSTKNFAAAFGQEALEVFRQNPLFEKCQPVLLGSWARGELMPKSDFDLGFLGPEALITECIRGYQESGLKIAARPLSLETIKSWPLVEQLALLQTQVLNGGPLPFDPAKQPLRDRQAFVRAILKDRQTRRERTSEFENLLEPQLKVGLGGLRDIQQTRLVMILFPDIWPDDHTGRLIEYYLWFFTTVRLKMHLLGAQDFLQAALQPELASWFGYSDFKQMMKEIQKGISRVLFYADWSCQWALLSQRERDKLNNRVLKNPKELIFALKRDPGILTQYQVRRWMDELVTPSWKKKSSVWIYRMLTEAFSIKTSNDFLMALFRSRLIDLFDPRLRALVGYNQHDQYHAYTADVHILNLLLEFKRAVKSPRRLGRFGKWVKQCTAKDKLILSWACYYHDLAKGQGGDHEELGRDYVRDDQKVFKQSQEWDEEIGWIVQNHLEFSKAAFRENPREEGTLKRLGALELNDERIRRLALFTVLDIRATHPKAWTPWKEKLLWDLGENLRRPKRIESLAAIQKLEKKYKIERLGLGLVESVGASTIASDLSKLKSSRGQSGFQVYRVKGGFWIRYFDPNDKPGILLSALKVLFTMGCSVQEAAIETLPGWGVYDWFRVESGLSKDVLQKRIAHMSPPEKINTPKLNWKNIEWLTVTEQSWTLLFRGRDQRGMLMATTEKLGALGAQIKSARAQTWGEQVEDIIEIDPIPGQHHDDWLKGLANALKN